MGYYNYQNGLIYRHLNQGEGWNSHLEHCRSFILKALDLYNPLRVTVLGSGWLLELPVAEMIERNIELDLIDIVHPPEVRRQTESYKNVKLIEADLSGGLIEEVWKQAHNHIFFNKLKSINSIIIPEYMPDGDPGMLISLNILTQLESLLLSFLRKRSRAPEEDLMRFRTEIQKKHIDFLVKHNSILITDYAEVFTSRSGVVSTVPTLVTELPGGKVREEWVWDFDQAGSDYYNRRSLLKVVAMII
jgi:hypothetical protein